MRKKLILGIFTLLLLTALGIGYYYLRPKPAVETKFVQNVREQISEIIQGNEVDLVEPGNFALVENDYHVYQTFNNCGPATLSMILAWHGINVSQGELGTSMRPYQNQAGDNDDKTIFTYEFVDWAEKHGLLSVGRVNGDIELLKKFTANGIPVVVKTWLNPNEDIGHFRLVRGFDEEKKQIIQDDSYQGPNRRISYFDFLAMWQPFNYDYMVVYTPEMKAKVEAIIGSELDEKVAWQNALTRAESERQLDPANPYPTFNIATASYQTGDYKGSVTAFEEVQNLLPKRMLWYQIEPILSYQKLGNYDRVFQITDNILQNGNRAFSELYLIRGEIYLEQGNKEAAREQFEQALLYNENLEVAKTQLQNL